MIHSILVHVLYLYFCFFFCFPCICRRSSWMSDRFPIDFFNVFFDISTSNYVISVLPCNHHHSKIPKLKSTSKVISAANRIAANEANNRFAKGMTANHDNVLHSSNKAPTVITTQQLPNSTSNQSHRLLKFIQKQKTTVTTAMSSSTTSATTKESSAKLSADAITAKSANKKNEKVINSNDALNGGHRMQANGMDRNGNHHHISKKSTPTKEIQPTTNHVDKNNVSQFVPSKRIIQHHDYQNLVDNASKAILSAAVAVKATSGLSSKMAIPNADHKRNSNLNNKNSTYDSVVIPYDGKYGVDKNNNSNHNKNNNGNRKRGEKESTRNESTPPIYRHFGDTHAQRNLPIRSSINFNGRSMSSTSLATTATANDNIPITYDKKRTKSVGQNMDCVYAPNELRHKGNAKMACRQNLNADLFPITSTNANAYITNSNLTNDTGFSSMDADNTSNVTPSTKITANQPLYSAYNQMHRISYDVKNRIKMFDVDATPYQPACHTNYKFYDKSNENRWVDFFLNSAAEQRFTEEVAVSLAFCLQIIFSLYQLFFSSFLILPINDFDYSFFFSLSHFLSINSHGTSTAMEIVIFILAIKIITRHEIQPAAHRI